MLDLTNTGASTIGAETTKSLQNNARDMIQVLSKILTPDRHGLVRFGAKNEPLRPSQIEGLQEEKAYLESGGTLSHEVAPGGSGKTRIGIVLAYAMAQHNRNSLFVVPNQQTLEDFVEKAKELCPDLDVGAVYQGQKRIGRLTFITYASLLRRTLGDEVTPEAGTAEVEQNGEVATNGRDLKIDPAQYDLVVWDETHQYLTANAQKLLRKFAHAINFGMTATPRYYEGKEVGGEHNPVFGKCVFNLSLAEAKKRDEACDYENILVNTDIVTGLRLQTPDQEESAEVAKAINRSDRNRIIADLYKNAKIKVKRKGTEKEYTLNGEPTIVFGGSINHVHQIADDVNAALSPLLRSKDAFKNDQEFRAELKEKGFNPDDPTLIEEAEEFRAMLRAKNIDPDKVENIIEPIHSGASEKYYGMTLGERTDLVERYHQRKVLMMASTSVLQQSFDSEMTSVVIDTVPRQTYVGVGQAAMRALRPGKDMAFVINIEDFDHQSLTLRDFERERGHEEGIILELARNHKKVHKKETSDSSSGIANYNLTYGSALNQLIQQRHNRQPGNDDKPYKITTAEYEYFNELVISIATGDKIARNELIQDSATWAKATYERIAGQVFEGQKVNKEDLEDIVTDVLLKALAVTESGAIGRWGRFSSYCQAEIKRQFEKYKKKHTVREDDPVVDNFSEEQELTLPHYDKDEVVYEELVDGVERSLRTLVPKVRRAVDLDYRGATKSEIAQMLEVSPAVASSMVARGQRALQDEGHQAPAVKVWAREHEKSPLQTMIDMQRNEANALKRRINAEIMEKIDVNMFMPLKQAFRKAIGVDENGYSPLFHDFSNATPYIYELVGTDRTDIIELHGAFANLGWKRLHACLVKYDYSQSSITNVKAAYEGLQAAVEHFKELGGHTYIPSNIRVPTPRPGLETPRTFAMMEEARQAEQWKIDEQKRSALKEIRTMQLGVNKVLFERQYDYADPVKWARKWDINPETLRNLTDYASDITNPNVSKECFDTSFIKRLEKYAEIRHGFVGAITLLEDAVERYQQHFPAPERTPDR